jgi:hypothetical protein
MMMFDPGADTGGGGGGGPPPQKLEKKEFMCGVGDEDLIIARTKEDHKGGSRISS